MKIISVDTNTSYMQFMVNLNKAIQKNRNIFMKGGSLEMMIADVLGPLYQVKNLQKNIIEELESLTNSLFEDVELNKIDAIEYSIKMESHAFVQNMNADLLLEVSKARYKDLLDIVSETNPELFSELPDYKLFLEQLFGQKSFELVYIDVKNNDDKTIQLFG